MSNLILAVPKELKMKIERFPEINWSAIARRAFVQKLHDIEFLENFKSESEFTEELALALGRKVSSAVAKKYFKQYKR